MTTHISCQTENNNFEMKLLDLQKQLGEEKKAHGETILQLLSAQARAQTAEAAAAKNQELVAETTSKLDQAREEIKRLRSQAQGDQAQAQEAQAKIKDLEAQMTQMRLSEQSQAQTAIEAQKEIRSLRAQAQTAANAQEEVLSLRAYANEAEAKIASREARMAKAPLVLTEESEVDPTEPKALAQEAPETAQAPTLLPDLIKTQELEADHTKIEGLEAQMAQMRVPEQSQDQTAIEVQEEDRSLRVQTEKLQEVQAKTKKATDTFALLKLPLKALRHALRVVSPSDLFILSLRFPKIRIAAKSITRHVAFLYVDARCEYLYSISVEGQNGLRTPVLHFLGRCQSLSRSTIWKIGEQEVDITITPSGTDQPVSLLCLPSSYQLLWTEIERCLAEIYGPCPLHVNISPSETQRFPRTENEIRKLIICRSGPTRYHGSMLDAFFDTQNVTEVARIGCKFHAEFRPDCKLLNVQEVCLTNASYFKTVHLMNFKGRHLNLYRPAVSTDEIVEFLRSWLQGTHQNLETVYLSQGDFQPDLIWRMAETEWFWTKRPGHYTATSQYSYDADGSKGYYDCTNTRDLIRHSDGRVASVKCTNDKFFFFVWPQGCEISVLSMSKCTD